MLLNRICKQNAATTCIFSITFFITIPLAKTVHFGNALTQTENKIVPTMDNVDSFIERSFWGKVALFQKLGRWVLLFQLCHYLRKGYRFC